MVDTDVNLDEQQYALNLDPESPPHSVDSTFDTLTGLDIFPLNKNTVGPIGAGNFDEIGQVLQYPGRKQCYEVNLMRLLN